MRFVSIYDAKPGQKLSVEVLDEFGRILIASEGVLTQQYIEKLRTIGIPGVYIDDEWSKGINISPPISPILRSEGMIAVSSHNIDACHEIAKQIVEEILKNGIHSVDMMDLRTFDNYTFAHSVNVAVLACTLGFEMRLPNNQLEDLVFAALLHDIGKVGIPVEIINKPGRLTPEEFALIKTHPGLSYSLIADRLDISSFVKNAVLCHHENYDGSGYPNGLAEDKIMPLARVLHVVDVYDALVSKRPYKEPYSPYVALEILEGGKGTLYDPEIVELFKRCVPLYPKGSTVELTDGTVGIVMENSYACTLLPRIRTEDMVEIDLADPENEHLRITSPSDQDYLDLLEQEDMRREMVTPFRKKKILILDMVGDSYRLLQHSLDYLYDFQWAQTDSQAEGYIKKDGLPDLLLVDIDNKDITGDEYIAEQNRRIAGKTPVLVLGSYRDVPTITRFRKLGISNYVLKPFRVIYVQSEIHNLLK